MSFLGNLLSRKNTTAARASSPAGNAFPAATSPTTEEEFGPLLTEVGATNGPNKTGNVFTPYASHGGGGAPAHPLAAGGGLHGGGRPVFGLEGGMGGGLNGGLGGGSGFGFGGGLNLGGGMFGHQQLGSPAVAGTSDLFGVGGTPANTGGMFTHGGVQDTGGEGLGQRTLDGAFGIQTPTPGGAHGATQRVMAPTLGAAAPAPIPAAAGTPGGAPVPPAASVPTDKLPLALQALAKEIGRFDVEGREAGIQASENAAKVKSDVFSAAYVILLMYVSGKNPKLRLIHSVALCAEDKFSPHSELAGKAVGFTVTSNQPQLLPQSSWNTWKEVGIPSAVEATIAAAADGAPPFGAVTTEEKKKLPFMKVVPASLAEMVYHWSVKELTCLECYDALCGEFPDKDKFAGEKEWLLGASQGENGTASNLNSNVRGVPDPDDAELIAWTKATLTQKGVLPKDPADPVTPAQRQNPGPPNGVSPELMFLQQQQHQFFAQVQQQQNQMMQLQYQQHAHQVQSSQNNTQLIVNQLQHGSSGGGLGVGLGSAGGEKSSSFLRLDETLAALCSLCHVQDVKLLPPWYNYVYGKKKSEIPYVRRELKEAVIKWAKAENVTIHKNFSPDDDAMWILMTANLRGTTDYQLEANKGLSPFAARVVTTQEEEQRRKDRHAEFASLQSRTFAEAAYLESKKGELPSPPGDLDSLKKVLGVFTGEVFVALGATADLYQQNLELVRALDDEEVEANSYKYLGQRCREIFWMVLVETKRYCNSAHTVTEFRNGSSFPKCNIRHYLTAVKDAAPITIMGFPEKWSSPPTGVTPAPSAPPAIAPQWNQNPLWAGYPPPMAFPPVAPPPAGGVQQQQGPTREQLSLENKQNLPPRAANAIDRVTKMFSKARLVHLVTAAGKQMHELPKIRGCKSCWNHFLGVCTREPCSFKHFQTALLQPAEYEECLVIMETGANKICSDKALPPLPKQTGKRKKAGE